MVTVRAYWSPVEAGLAKSLLDDYEISCALVDEDTNRYSGAPFAVPTRLLVLKDQADQAIRILNGDLEGAAKLQEVADNTELQSDVVLEPEDLRYTTCELLDE